MIPIIIPHKNRYDRLAECLSTIPPEFKVYIIKEGTFAESCNKGFEMAKNNEGVIFMNDDVLLDEYILTELIQLSGQADIVGTPEYVMREKKVFYGVEFRNNWFYLTARKTTVVMPHGALFYIKSKVFDDCGRFYEGYRNGFEDVELFLTALEKGYKFAYTRATVKHYHGQSADREKYMAENGKTLRSRFPLDRIKSILKIGEVTK